MKSFKIRILITTGVIMMATSAILFAGCGNNAVQNPGAQASVSANPATGAQTGGKQSATAGTAGSPASSAPGAASSAAGPVQGDTDGDGIPDSIEKTYGTNPYAADTDGDGINDKQDNNPVFADNPIKETSTAALPITVKDAKVEDNATSDHLEISVTNTGKSDLTNFDIYYTITDKVANKQEAYYQKLSGLSIKPGETQTVHFDNDVSKPGHYCGNMNGLYGTSSNGLTFDVILHSNGFKPCEFTVEKAKGTAEVAD